MSLAVWSAPERRKSAGLALIGRPPIQMGEEKPPARSVRATKMEVGPLRRTFGDRLLKKLLGEALLMASQQREKAKTDGIPFSGHGGSPGRRVQQVQYRCFSSDGDSAERRLE
jgi:hypothetical protein